MADVDDEHLTAAEIRARIAEQVAMIGTLQEEAVTADRDIAEASERQRLRRELDERRSMVANFGALVRHKQSYRRKIDADVASGPGAPDDLSLLPPTKKKRAPSSSLAKSTISYASDVVKREFIWEVQGLSWIEQKLTQEGRACTNSNVFDVDASDASSKYMLVFSPRGGSLKHDADDDFMYFDDDLAGTLALIRRADSYGTSLCYRFFLRDASGEFQPLGEATRVAVAALDSADDIESFVGGPDLETESKGLFGLSFDALLASEWVTDDAICFKVCIEEAVMMQHPDSSSQIRVGKTDVVYEHKPPSVEVPPSTLQADLLSLLTEGRHSDVTIEATCNGEAAPVTFSAHTGILSQRSDVFAAAFSHEMRESATRTLTVTDVPPPALKALLHFLYTDDFDEVQKVLREERGSSSSSSSSGGASPSSGGSSAAAASSSASGSEAEQSIAQLQAVLAVAHKYGVLRLLRWAEGQLCDKLSCEMACSLLSLAHVYGATELERNCLAFMKANMARVVTRADFAALAPESLVKFHMHCAGVDPAEEEPGRKRKRDEE